MASRLRGLHVAGGFSAVKPIPRSSPFSGVSPEFDLIRFNGTVEFGSEKIFLLRVSEALYYLIHVKVVRNTFGVGSACK